MLFIYKSCCENDLIGSIDMAQDGKSLVIFIHGTFAPGAIWTRQDSPLYLAIQQRIPNSVVFPFGWSGKNSHKERLAAASELQKYIRNLKELNPEAHIFLIAHSHGGNVALHALRDQELQLMVEGLVCLATPFIVIAPRKTISSHTKGIGIFLGVCLSVLVISVVKEEWGKFLEVAIGLSGVALSVVIGFRIASFLRRVSIPRMRSILTLLRPPLKTVVPILSVSYKGDEAAWWLRMVTFFMSAPFLLADLTVLILMLALLALCGILILATIPFIRYFMQPLAKWLMELAAPMFVIGLGLTAISWVGIVTVAVSLLSRRWGFGRYLSGTYILTKVSAKKLPPTKCPQQSVEGDAAEGLARIGEKTGRKPWRIPGVVHSLAYRDPWAIDIIVDWITNRTRQIKPVSVNDKSRVKVVLKTTE